MRAAEIILMALCPLVLIDIIRTIYFAKQEEEHDESTMKNKKSIEASFQEKEIEEVLKIEKSLNFSKITNSTSSTSARNTTNTTTTTAVPTASTVPNTTIPSKLYEIDVIIYLNGEFGNHIYKIAMAQGIQFVVDEYNLPIKLKFHHLNQGISKSRRPAQEIPMCFSFLQNDNLYECNVPSYKLILDQQEKLFGINATILHTGPGYDGKTPEDMKYILEYVMASMDTGTKHIEFHQLQTILNNNDILPLSIPFILADTFAYDGLVDRYIHEYKNYFKFNETNCCVLSPDEDETVLHIRGFVTEMPRVGRAPEWTELDPNRTAHELLGHLNAGDKVALLSRFEHILVPYKEALEARGVVARIVAGQSGPQDFCFLRKAKKEIIGQRRSTFVIWSSLLSEVKSVTLYSVLTDEPFFFGDYLGNIFHFKKF